MPLEIERKFLVDTRKWNPTDEGNPIGTGLPEH